MSTVKVIHIITKLELGGAQQNTLFTVSHLNAEKFQTFLIAGKGGELFEKAQTLKNVFVAPDLIRQIRLIRDIKALVQLTGIIKKIKQLTPKSAPLIVHTHSSKAGILGRWAAKFSGVPIIIHSIHGFGFNDYQHFLVRNFFILLEKITARITTTFIAVSRANIEQGERLGIISRTNTRLIRSGIDIAGFQASDQTESSVKASLGIPVGAPVVSMIACLKPQKAPLDFIRACQQIRNQIPDAHFLLVGDGILRSAAQKEVAQRSMQECFHFLGWRTDIPAIMQATTVLALTSLWEGLPKVLPQAMAAGIPIVATKVDGSPEAVKDGFNGFLVNPGDIQGIAEKVTFLLQNPRHALEMGKKGNQNVGEFDIHHMVKAQEELYDELSMNSGGT